MNILMFLVLLFTVSNTQSYKSSYKKSGKGKYHAENHMNKNNVDYSNYSFRQDESNSIVTFNKKRVSTKVLRSGVSDKLSCDLNKWKDDFVWWQFMIYEAVYDDLHNYVTFHNDMNGMKVNICWG